MEKKEGGFKLKTLLPTESDPKNSGSGSNFGPKSSSTEQAPQTGFFARKKEEQPQQSSFFGKSGTNQLLFNNKSRNDASDKNPSEPTSDSGVFFKDKPQMKPTVVPGGLFQNNGAKKFFIPKQDSLEKEKAGTFDRVHPTLV